MDCGLGKKDPPRNIGALCLSVFDVAKKEKEKKDLFHAGVCRGVVKPSDAWLILKVLLSLT